LSLLGLLPGRVDPGLYLWELLGDPQEDAVLLSRDELTPGKRATATLSVAQLS
jgi:hypothetical protein